MRLYVWSSRWLSSKTGSHTVATDIQTNDKIKKTPPWIVLVWQCSARAALVCLGTDFYKSIKLYWKDWTPLFQNIFPPLVFWRWKALSYMLVKNLPKIINWVETQWLWRPYHSFDTHLNIQWPLCGREIAIHRTGTHRDWTIAVQGLYSEWSIQH